MRKGIVGSKKDFKTKNKAAQTEIKDLKTKCEDVVNFLKEPGIDYKSNDESDDDDEE